LIVGTKAALAEIEELDEELAPVEAEELPATVDPRNTLNDLTAKEWIPETVSVWNQRGLGAGHPDAQIERQHPAPFSFTDVGRLIRFFTKRGHTVLDPFVGVGSTLKACAIDGRNGIGIELNPTFADLSRKRLQTEVRDMFASVADQKILEGDARDLLPTIPSESVDFVVTSPPYWSILKKVDHKVRQERIEKGLARHYGDDPRDLGKIEDYTEFLDELARILGDCARTLRAGKYMAVVVSDFRDKSRYVMFHSDLAHALEEYGLEMRGLTVLYQRHKKIFPYGYPYSFVPNVHNQYILILQKPKSVPKKAPTARKGKNT
jgi:DNA modification methylase